MVTSIIKHNKRIEAYSGITDVNGVFTIVFNITFNTTPLIITNIVNGTINQEVIITSITITGFTVTVLQRNTSNILGTMVLLPTGFPVKNAIVNVLIIEK